MRGWSQGTVPVGELWVVPPEGRAEEVLVGWAEEVPWQCCIVSIKVERGVSPGSRSRLFFGGGVAFVRRIW